MKITLKTKDLTIQKPHDGFEGIIIPLNIQINDVILSDLTYVLDKDFHGIVKDTPLQWMYKIFKYGSNWVTCLIIPVEENIGDAYKEEYEKFLEIKKYLGR